ncbi:hypothetical protein EVAR_14177_1 [Eumeta japonica]|uniref:Uncharacterized protein n=1 Tax=Eumeta variegata TaxID=151549 RepID=A0A4C1UFZ9_EUMVA|nr:hypothetical protein EVAR_14177_1 [Eumeta japonica]
METSNPRSTSALSASWIGIGYPMEAIGVMENEVGHRNSHSLDGTSTGCRLITTFIINVMATSGTDGLARYLKYRGVISLQPRAVIDLLRRAGGGEERRAIKGCGGSGVGVKSPTTLVYKKPDDGKHFSCPRPKTIDEECKTEISYSSSSVACPLWGFGRSALCAGAVRVGGPRQRDAITSVTDSLTCSSRHAASSNSGDQYRISGSFSSEDDARDP